MWGFESVGGVVGLKCPVCGADTLTYESGTNLALYFVSHGDSETCQGSGLPVRFTPTRRDA